MLRRKLLLMLGPLVVLLAATSVVAIWLLQDLLNQLDHISSEASAVVVESNQLSTTISVIEVELYELQSGRKRRLDTLVLSYQSMEELVASLGQRYVMRESGIAATYRRMEDRLPIFGQHINSLATAQDPALAAQHNVQALADVVSLRQDVLEVSRYAGKHAQIEQQALASRFKWLVLGLALVFLVVINVSVIVLLRMAGMILRPVERLVEATQQLAAERFEHRVQLDQKDEFGQLAGAYNSLAEQLQTNEARKLEMLGQVAVTLNHELNNALAIIELQLGLMSRQSPASPNQEKHLREIRASLGRMAHTVESLKHVRQIVLTDYAGGMKMLDLTRSIEAPGAGEQQPASSPAPPA